jgi:histone H3/H4
MIETGITVFLALAGAGIFFCGFFHGFSLVNVQINKDESIYEDYTGNDEMVEQELFDDYSDSRPTIRRDWLDGNIKGGFLGWLCEVMYGKKALYEKPAEQVIDDSACRQMYKEAIDQAIEEEAKEAVDLAYGGLRITEGKDLVKRAKEFEVKTNISAIKLRALAKGRKRDKNGKFAKEKKSAKKSKPKELVVKPHTRIMRNGKEVQVKRHARKTITW